MGRKRHNEEQIISILKEADAGVNINEVCRKHEISNGTYYKWKSKYGGMEVNEAKRLRTLEDENRRLKQIVAEQTLDIQCLKAVLEKKF